MRDQLAAIGGVLAFLDERVERLVVATTRLVFGERGPAFRHVFRPAALRLVAARRVQLVVHEPQHGGDHQALARVAEVAGQPVEVGQDLLVERDGDRLLIAHCPSIRHGRGGFNAGAL